MRNGTRQKSFLAEHIFVTATTLTLFSATIHAIAADVTVSSGTTVNAQAIADGSTLTVQSGGTVTDASDAVTDAVDGTSISVGVQNAAIRSTGANAINTTGSNLTLSNSGTIDGHINGVLGTGVLNDLINSGLLTGVTSGVNYATITALTNTGTISSAATAITGTDIGQITNSGKIEGTSTYGIVANNSISSVTNTGEIVAGDNAIIAGTGSIGSIVNSGSISATDTDLNDHAITAAFMISSLINSGSISATGGAGLISNDVGSVTNSGLISGGLAGIFSAGDLEYLYNSGTITAGLNGVYVDDQAKSIYNSGSITGGVNGISVGSVVSFVNLGNITGTTSDGILVGCTCGITYLFNSGSITGADDGIDSPVITDLINSGTITGDVDGIFSPNIVSLVNSGTISGTNGSGIFGDTGSALTRLVNAGTIVGSDNGIDIDTITTLINSGQINGQNDDAIKAGTIAYLYNSGTIVAPGDIDGDTHSGIDADFGTIVNVGTIKGEVGIEFDRSSAGNASVNNNGTISSVLGAAGTAIDFQGTGSDTLTLGSNSVIIGSVLWDGSDDTLNISSQTSAKLTLSNLPAQLNLSSPLTDVTGTTVTQADTTFMAAIDDTVSLNLNGLNGLVFDRLGQSFSTFDGAGSTSGGTGFGYTVPDQSQKYSAWVSGWGSISKPADLDETIIFAGGVLFGIDTIADGQYPVGFFTGAGLSRTKIGPELSHELSQELGHEVDSQSYYIGGYTRLYLDETFIDLTLQGGVLSFDSKRHITNNNLGSGRETASANYHGYYFSPEIKIGQEIDLQQGYFVIPSLSFGYSGTHVNAYEETGSSANISVQSRFIQNASLSAKLATGKDRQSDDGKELRTEAFFGLNLTHGFGDANSANATLLNTTSRFDPGGQQNTYSGFAGISMNKQLAENARLNASFLLSLSEGGGISGTASLKYGIKF